MGFANNPTHYSPKIQEIVKEEKTPYLFVRIKPKIKSKTQPFVYCGRLRFLNSDKTTSKPVHLTFSSLDYSANTDKINLLDIYSWLPKQKGLKSKYTPKENFNKNSGKRGKLNKPNETERKGLVTSRVGQGYYRQEILRKWNNTCPVTKCSMKEILISSHILKWSEANNEERLDVENGILLSPNVDALFDKHIISFKDNGQIIFSNKITEIEFKKLGLKKDLIIPITEGMKKYLKRHRVKLV